MPHIEPIQPREETYTRWSNPLDVPQVVDISIDDPRRPIRYTWKPGETKSVPSAYDPIIQRVRDGVVVGGLAPQLVREGQTEKLDVALDASSVERKSAMAELAAASLAKAAQEQAMMLAQAKVVELDAKQPPAPTGKSKG